MTLLGLLRRTKPQASTTLANVLAELSIEPFDRESVERYKKEKKEATFTQLLPKGNWVRMTSEGIPMAQDEVVLTAWAIDNGFDVAFFGETNRRSIPHAIFLRWRRMSIAEAVASIGVPDYVAHKTNQILEKAPDAIIEVDALESRTQGYDPFLVVKQGNEEHYVEVWGADEREFQR